MHPLTAYVERLRQVLKCEVPDFDPLDGGVNARVLFLFEKPGPKTSVAGGGSGFISRNNDDPTAENTFNFMLEAGLARTETVIWNVIPGWNGTIVITNAEKSDSLSRLDELLNLLPKIDTIVLVGNEAKKATKHLAGRYKLIASMHPSPMNKKFNFEKWRQIGAVWVQARAT